MTTGRPQPYTTWVAFEFICENILGVSCEMTNVDKSDAHIGLRELEIFPIQIESFCKTQWYNSTAITLLKPKRSARSHKQIHKTIVTNVVDNDGC
uniref:Uncharacterized protein n=1 Tax=Glossina palpalis gambiensis TaxID=67801 RepID=A0A1B0B479_9MUSC